ncbi:MAG: DUF4381 family protein [Rhodanobacteraceae bacterium]
MSPVTGPKLRDIHLPPPPSWWPPAPGWWLLAALVLAVVAWAIWLLIRRWRLWRWRRRIHAQLAALAAVQRADPDGPRFVAGISQLLRRATLLLDRRAAALSGQRWLEFLDARMGGDAFTRGAGRVLIDAPYRRTADVDASALLQLARRWFARALAAPPRRRSNGSIQERWLRRSRGHA